MTYGKKTACVLLLLCTVAALVQAGVTGKVAGKVTDKSSGEALVGVNVILSGTQLGAASDLEGEYTILQVPPGEYELQVSMIGYKKITVKAVRVFIDQTTRVDVSLEQQTVELGETIITAERKLVKPDVSTSVVQYSEKEMAKMPVNNVIDVVNLQAGTNTGGLANGAGNNFVSSMQYTRGKVSVQGGLSIRGGEGDNILFMVDGVTMRDPRNNEPATRVALSGVEQVSVERGGFNAEYGQVRSGIVNVIPKEGAKRGYTGTFQYHFSPPAPKYWLAPGAYHIHDPRSFVMRPFFDDAVAWTGTNNGAWDEYTRKQYPEFAGWNEISRILNTDNNPNNDLTPIGAQRAFMYETRKKQINDQPDYDIDAGFGGPVPLVSEMLGDLRFFATYRSNREMLLFPMTRPDYSDYDWTLRVNSDITPSMKLRFYSLFGKQFTIRHNWDATGIYFYPRTPQDIAGVSSGITSTADLIGLFSDYNFSLADIGQRSLAGRFTHTLSAETYYEVSVENFAREYNVRPSAPRDLTKLYEILPGYYQNSNPFGYYPKNYEQGVIIFSGGHVSKARDFSTSSSTTAKVDLTSQVNFENLVKAGVEFVYTDLNFDYGNIASLTEGQAYATRTQMRAFPIRAAMYVQDKLETHGFILNAGLRLDYSNSNTNWWQVGQFDYPFLSSDFDESKSFARMKSEPQWQVSPRLGIAHPITENSKLFFNYGHFKQVPQYESIFRVQRNQDKSMSSFGNPNLTLAKTVSYELGYDQLLMEDYLIQIAAFYNDITNQQDFVTFISKDGYSYTLATSQNYEDVRGLEITLRKTISQWWSALLNYTYQVGTAGHFGSSRYFDDPQRQKNWDEATIHSYQNRPSPTPFARAHVNVFTPADFGPEILGHKIFGDFVINTVWSWSAGGKTTYNPNNLPTVAYNVQQVDYYNANLRIDKNIDISKFRITLFAEINNVFNTLRLWNTGDQEYLRSLHLPKSDAYPNIPGEDKVGDYRKLGVEFQPMEHVSRIDFTQGGKERAWYYEDRSGEYWQYTNDPTKPIAERWSKVEQAKVRKALDDKAYIDMPNASTYWFLDPRRTYFGIKVSFNFLE